MLEHLRRLVPLLVPRAPLIVVVRCAPVEVPQPRTVLGSTVQVATVAGPPTASPAPLDEVQVLAPATLDEGPPAPLEVYDDDAVGPLRVEANGQGVLAYVPFEIRHESPAAEPKSGAEAADDEQPHPDQVPLFPPSIMRRQSVRRVRAFRYFDLSGELVRRTVVETVPVVRTTAADDAGLPEAGRWTPPRHSRDFDTLPYAEDISVRAFVRDHPDGASLQDVADEIGWTKQGIMEVERRAMRKILELARTDADAREWLGKILELDGDAEENDERVLEMLDGAEARLAPGVRTAANAPPVREAREAKRAMEMRAA